MLAFTTLGSKAQPVLDTLPWCPPGATWVYDMFCQTCNLYYEISFVKDTTMLNQDAKKLNTRFIQMDGFNPNFRLVTELNPIFLVKTGDSISIIDSGQIKFLYKIRNQIGDKYVINMPFQSCPSDTNFDFLDTIEIKQAIWIDTINNVIYQSYKQKSSVNSKDNWIVDNIGPRLHFFNRPSISQCPNSIFKHTYYTYFENLKCYSDSIRGDIMFYDRGGFSCRSVKTSISETQLTKSSLAIFPNPTNGKITIEIKDDTPSSVMLYDMIGKRIVEKSIQENYTTFNNISSGVYLIHVIGESKKIYQQKLIIE